MDDLKALACPATMEDIINGSNENGAQLKEAVDRLEEEKADLSFVSPGGIIPFPEGGQYRTNAWSVDGTAKITLPVSWSDTMLTFSINLFEYREAVCGLSRC